MASRTPNWLRAFLRVLQTAVSLAGAAALTLAVFLVLPVMQQMANPPEEKLLVHQVGAVVEPPPPPPVVEEEPPPEEEEPPPPELSEEAPPLDLAQLEMALNPGFGEGIGGDFEVRLFTAGESGNSEEADAIFSMAELDQPPRVVYQPAPEYPPELKRRNIQGTVYIVFVVDKMGRVVNPIIQKSAHSAFEAPALRAIKRWRFEPGQRKGQPVQFKMRVPITFAGG